MLEQKSLYEPTALSSLFDQYTKQYRQELNCRQIVLVSQKDVLMSLLYIMQGIPMKPFDFLQEKHLFYLKEKVQMTHLTSQSLQKILSKAIESANNLLYLKQKNIEVVQNHSNPIVKSFGQGIKYYLNQSNLYYASLLTQVQKQIGNLPSLPNDPSLSLLVLCSQIDKKQYILKILLKIMNSILTSASNASVLILNGFFEQAQQFSNHNLYKNDIRDLFSIFSYPLKHYILIIKDWLALKDPKQSIQFFIRQPTQQEKQKSNAPEADFFFHYANPLYISALPNIFRPYAKTLLQIGKTIRYIILFFNEIEKKDIINFINLELEFKQIIEMCEIPPTSVFQKKFKQIIEMCEIPPTSVFQKKPSKLKNIGSKLKNKKNQLFESTKVNRDNPYEMFPTTHNAFSITSLGKKSQNKNNLKLVKQQNLDYENFEVGFQLAFKGILKSLNEKCYRLFSSDSIQELVKVKNCGKIRSQIKNTLIGIKQFMLHAQGDFFHELITLIYDTMERPMNMIASHLVTSYIEQAKRTSSAKQLPQQILKNVTFTYLKNPEKSQYIRGWHNFSIIYKPTYPTNYIFTSKIIDYFGQIFNFLFQIKKCEYAVTQLWEDYKDRQQIFYSIVGFRNALSVFIKTLLSHLMMNIEVEWVQFIEKFNETKTILEIIELTHKTVIKLRKMTVDDRTLVQVVEALMDIVDRFKKFHFKCLDYQIQQAQLCILRGQLRGIIESIKRIEDFKEIIDYNQFYHKNKVNYETSFMD